MTDETPSLLAGIEAAQRKLRDPSARVVLTFECDPGEPWYNRLWARILSWGLTMLLNSRLGLWFIRAGEERP